MKSFFIQLNALSNPALIPYVKGELKGGPEGRMLTYFATVMNYIEMNSNDLKKQVG